MGSEMDHTRDLGYEPAVRTRDVALLAAFFSAVVAALVLAGWAFGIPQLTTFGFTRGQVAPTTALCFALASIALLVDDRAPRALRGLRLAGAIAIVALGLVRLVANVAVAFGHPFAAGVRGFAAASEMASNTAVAIVLLGVALVIVDRVRGERRTPLVRYLVAAIMFCASTGLITSILQLDSAYGTSEAGRMSVPTACCLLVLAIGLFNIVESFSSPKGQFSAHVHSITWTAAVVLIVVTTSTGLCSFAVEERYAERVALSSAADELWSEQSLLETSLVRRLYAATRAERGTIAAPASGPLHVRGTRATTLEWADGFVLRTETPTGPFLQRWQIGSALERRIRSIRGFNRLLLCERGAETTCVPNEPASQLLADAVRASGGVSSTARRIRVGNTEVVAASLPLAGTGFQILAARDLANVYEPLHEQYWLVYALMALLVAFGLAVLDLRLSALVASLVLTRARARSNEARFVAAAEGSLDAFYILESVRDPLGRIVDFRCTYVNGQGERLLRRTNDRIVGKTFGDVLPGSMTNGFFEQICEVVLTGNALSEEREIATGAVAAGWVHHQIVRLDDGVAITSRDITARKQSAASLEEAIRFRTAIVDSAPCAIISYDADGAIVSVNRTGQSALGFAEHELVGRTDLFSTADEADRTSVEDDFVRARAGHVCERECTVVRKDGSHFLAKLTISPLRGATGAIDGFLGIAYDITEDSRIADQMRFAATHDALTGLPNRSLLEERAAIALERAREDESTVTVFMVDLDHFKRVNDSLGHHVGDDLLRVVAERLKTSVRVSDTVARMGGDEFIVMLQSPIEDEQAAHLAQKMIDAISAPIVIDSFDLRITPSIGFSTFPNDGPDLATLLRNADAAMYRAKALGRNTFESFRHEIALSDARFIALEKTMRRALDEDGFDLAFQPQVDLASGAIVGVEALVRLTDENGVAVSPTEFVAIAEETGMIVPLGAWVLRSSCLRVAALQRELGSDFRVAVNLSAHQFRQKRFVEFVESVLAETQLAPSSLELEITESVLMDDSEAVLATLRRMRDLGISIAVDDFGTGYSSLSYLRRFPIDRLKIDRSFIRNAADNRDDATVTGAIIALAHSLDIPVVAEGVETEAQREFLVAHGCDEAQGYLFARPMPAERLPRYFSALGTLDRTPGLLMGLPSLSRA